MVFLEGSAAPTVTHSRGIISGEEIGLCFSFCFAANGPNEDADAAGAAEAVTHTPPLRHRVCVCFHSCVRFGWIGWMKRSPLAAGVRGGPRSSIWRVPGFQGCRKPGRIHAWQFHTRSIRVRSARQKREKLCFFHADFVPANKRRLSSLHRRRLLMRKLQNCCDETRLEAGRSDAATD